MSYTIVQYHGQQNSRCGYCKGKKTSRSNGMHAYNLLLDDYQTLIDRGWRRCGLNCYKPNNKITCCPCYTIRCAVLEFKLSKSHKKILRRMNRFLRDGKKEKIDDEQESLQDRSDTKRSSNDDEDDNMREPTGIDICNEPQAPDVTIPVVNLEQVQNVNGDRNKEAQSSTQASLVAKDDLPKANSIEQNARKTASNLSLNNEMKPCKKAKQIRLERRNAKLAAKGLIGAPTNINKINNQEKTLVEYINDTRSDDKHKLKLILIDVKSQAFTDTLNNTYQLYKKYQTIIHNDPPSDVKEYQHFLQRTPMELEAFADLVIAPGFGSFHQQYWLDDKLIAVGVIDILPKCVSSVYFFYDPDYNFLSMGTYASLREIELVQQLAKNLPSLKYYYMGFYIHSCPKMRYKGRLAASYLLCPEKYTWNILNDEIRSKLDINKYQRLDNDPESRDVQEFTESDLDKTLILRPEISTFSTYQQYKQFFTGSCGDRELLLEYGKLVGKNCAHRFLFVKASINSSDALENDCE